MSYNLYVTRAEEWFEVHSNEKISKREFVDFIKSHKKMRLVYQTKNKVTAVFISFAHKGTPFEEWSITWSDGLIQTDSRAVPQEVGGLLLEMARQFRANVLGEECEKYDKKLIQELRTISDLIEMEENLSKTLQNVKNVQTNRDSKASFAFLDVILLTLTPIGWIILLFLGIRFVLRKLGNKNPPK